MNQISSLPLDARRPIDQWLGNYAEDHRNKTNQIIHWFCVPFIVWCVVAAFWSIPLPRILHGLFSTGVFAGAMMFCALLYYLKLSRALALGMLIFFALCSLVTQQIYLRVGGAQLALTALVVFVVAWVVQFIGHEIEGKRPSFLTDVQYLMIGPLWLLSKLYRRIGIKY